MCIKRINIPFDNKSFKITGYMSTIYFVLNMNILYIFALTRKCKKYINEKFLVGRTILLPPKHWVSSLCSSSSLLLYPHRLVLCCFTTEFIIANIRSQDEVRGGRGTGDWGKAENEPPSLIHLFFSSLILFVNIKNCFMLFFIYILSIWGFPIVGLFSLQIHVLSLGQWLFVIKGL